MRAASTVEPDAVAGVDASYATSIETEFPVCLQVELFDYKRLEQVLKAHEIYT